MKILMLLFNPAGKGTYWRGLHLGRSLAKQGHEITIVSTSQKRRLRNETVIDEQHGLTRIETPALLGGGFRFGYDPWGTLYRRMWARGKTFDLVHGFESRPSVILPAMQLKKGKGIPLILDWADWFGRGGSVEERGGTGTRNLLRPVETFFEERYRTKADGATVINSFLRARASTLGVAPSSIYDLPNGCDIENIRPIPKKEARQKLGLDENRLYIGYIGVLFQRDAILMAQAFNQVHQADPRTTLLLVGYNDIPVEGMVDQKDSVKRVGRIKYEEISTYLSACDLCWLPLADSGANRGRFPLKINDYMAAGRPVVSTDVSDLKRMINAHQFGVVAPPDHGALAAKTLTLIHDAQRCEILGENARRAAETVFNWDKIAEGLTGFYEKIISASQQ